MQNPAELEEPKPSPEGEKKPPVSKSGTEAAAARSMDEVNNERLKTGAPKHESLLTRQVTVTGAMVSRDNNDLVKEIKRSDGTALTNVRYDEKTRKVESFTQITADQRKIVYKRAGSGDTLFAFTPEGRTYPREFARNKVELSQNGNIVFNDAKGDKVIVRGNGAVLAPGEEKYDVQFDADGRIKKITPGKEALAAGAKIREFGYVGKTEELSEVKVEWPEKFPGSVFTHTLNQDSKQWECKDQNGQAQVSPPGKRAISREGVFVHQEAIQAGNKPSRVCNPSGVEELQNSYSQADGSKLVKTYNEEGKWIGVQTIAPKLDANGKVVKDKNGNTLDGIPGKKYQAVLREGQPPLIEEFDPRDGTKIIWAKPAENDPTKGDIRFGQVVTTGANSPFQRGQILGPRYDLNFFETGLVQYRDEDRALHTEFPDRSQKIEFINGSFMRTDQQGKAMIAMKDSKNGLQFLRQQGAGGREELARVDSIINGERQQAWRAEGKVGIIQPDGRFSYEDKDGKLVFLDLDSSSTKFQIGKDGNRLTLTPIEVELPLQNGVKPKRVIEPGADSRNPKSIIDTFVDDQGRSIRRSIEALPITTPTHQLAAHNQRLQQYKLKEEVLSTTNFKQPQTKPQVLVEATLTNVEVLKNGDLLITAPMDGDNPFQPFKGARYELKAKSMPDSILPNNADRSKPPKSMTPVNPAIRLKMAKELFEPVFAKEVAPKLPIKSDGKPYSADDFMNDYLLFPKIDAVPNLANKAGADDALAYRYELAYLLVRQQTIDYERKAGKRTK